MDADVKHWQARMAPFMIAAVIFAALFFAVATIWKFGDMEARTLRPPPVSAPTWTGATSPKDFDQQMQLAELQASYSLEADLIARRYDGGNLAFISRLWTRFMGFVTGMILALVGAAFVLGKLETEKGEIEAAARGISVAMRTTSPGLLLAFLGTLLMGLSIALPVTVHVKDGAIYFPRPAVDVDEKSPPFTSAGPSNNAEPQPRRSHER
jgi:hypothetical protein